MNKETIENAANEYAIKLRRMDNEWGVPPNASMGSVIKSSFEAGIHWHINALWHDKSELPRICKYIFVECKNVDTPPSYCVIESWDFKRYSVSRWAYLEDLLPD